MVLRIPDPISPTINVGSLVLEIVLKLNKMNNIFVHVSVSLNNISYKNDDCSFEDSWNIIKKQIGNGLPYDSCGRADPSALNREDIEAIFKGLNIEVLEINSISPISYSTAYNVIKAAHHNTHRTGYNRYVSCIEIYAECGCWRIVPIKWHADKSVGSDSFYINNSDGDVSTWSSVSRYSAKMSYNNFWNNCSFKDYYEGTFDPYVRSQDVPKFEWRERKN